MYSIRKGSERSRANQSVVSTRNQQSSIANSSYTSSRNNLSRSQSKDFIIDDHFSQQEQKQVKLEYKKFCNKIEIMTKKGFLEYFRLEDLEGTLIADRLYSCFSPSGSIDFSKFLKGIGILSLGSLDSKILFLFTLFDLKKNKVIEKSDMKRVLLSLLGIVLEIEIDQEDLQIIQEDVRNMSLQEREEIIEIILQPYGSVITFEEFSNYLLNNSIIRQVLE